MQMAMHPVMRIQLRCRVCGRPRDDGKESDTTKTTRLFGAKRYAVCCGCGQAMIGPWTTEYERRWVRHRLGLEYEDADAS